jgi:hypothetical protein
LLSNKLHLTAADPQCQLLVTAHKHTHSLEGPSRPLVHAGGLFLLRRAYVNIGFATDRKILVFEHLAFARRGGSCSVRLDRGVRNYLRRGGYAWLIQSLPLVKTLRTQERRDQRTGSIKCSYCVPGHMT